MTNPPSNFIRPNIDTIPFVDNDEHLEVTDLTEFHGPGYVLQLCPNTPNPGITVVVWNEQNDGGDFFRFAEIDGTWTVARYGT